MEPTRTRAHSIGSVVVAEDDEDLRFLVCTQLERAGFAVYPASDGEAAIYLVHQQRPDLVVLDVNMPVKSGYEVLRDISGSTDARVIMLTAQNSSADIVKGLSMGAHDHVAKPFDSTVLVARTKAALRTKRTEDELRSERDQMNELALTDGLTGLPNRRSLDRAFHAMAATALQRRHDIGVIMLDIDHFKMINDTFGHEIGDVVLKAIARSIEASLRVGDLAGRWGGEEFVVFLPEADEVATTHIAERIRSAITGMSIEMMGSVTQVSASMGCASWLDHHDEVFAAADAALYRAKEAGRNRVVSDGGQG